jgi:hypothetical protein
MILNEEDWQITCHEAGHAIAACRNGLLFDKLMRGDGDLGMVTVGVDNPRDNPYREWPLADIGKWQQFYTGGAAAERIMFGNNREYASKMDFLIHSDIEKKWRSGRLDGWNDDIAHTMSILDRFSIEKVANTLLLARERSGTFRRGELSIEQVCRLLGCPVPDY